MFYDNWNIIGDFGTLSLMQYMYSAEYEEVRWQDDVKWSHARIQNLEVI